MSDGDPSRAAWLKSIISIMTRHFVEGFEGIVPGSLLDTPVTKESERPPGSMMLSCRFPADTDEGRNGTVTGDRLYQLSAVRDQYLRAMVGVRLPW
jgi:hypothetical protein